MVKDCEIVQEVIPKGVEELFGMLFLWNSILDLTKSG